MSLLSIRTETPLGEFHMIIERNPESEGDYQDIVRASGFRDIETLFKRLPFELRESILEKEVGEHSYRNAVRDYFDGDKSALGVIKHEQKSSFFNEKVWNVISRVQSGTTISYKELAEKVGNPSAVRTVGTVCGLNRLILIVPCHRIVKTDGTLGGYLYGLDIKKYLLELEGARKKAAPTLF